MFLAPLVQPDGWWILLYQQVSSALSARKPCSQCASPSTFPNAAGAAAYSSLPFISQQMLLELLLHVKFRHAQHHLDPCTSHAVPG